MFPGYLFIANGIKSDSKDCQSFDSVAIGSFEASSLWAARESGFRIYFGIARDNAPLLKCASLDYNITYYDHHCYRNPFAFYDNIQAYKNTVAFLQSHSDIEIIHCNTPIGGVIGRICGKICKIKKIIYMAHGFHFYKGAPILNWLLYYPIEKLLARYTDVLITINSEDYERAKNFRLRKGGKLYYVPGVGIELAKYYVDRTKRDSIRKKLGIGNDDIMLLSVGRLDKNKNNAVLINALAKMNNQSIFLILCGDGEERLKLEHLATDLSVASNIKFLGRCSNIVDMYNAADIFLLASFREGLSRSIMEAMSVGLPCVVSKIRGNVDLIDELGGICVAPKDSHGFANAVLNLVEDYQKRVSMGIYNQTKVKQFDIETVKKIMLNIFTEVAIGL